MKGKFIVAAVLLGSLLSLNAQAQVKLNGAGATFPYIIYSKWFDLYNKQTGIEINYQAIGSGGGVKQVTEGTVDFGASDAYLSDKQLRDIKKKRGSAVLHIPTVMGAVVVSYNLPPVGKGLKLTPDVLADIFLGKIKMWNDSRIVKINKGKNLPKRPILVVHRSDGSGTTNIFTDYLSKVSKNWEKKVGVGKAVKWPIGLGGKGNDGVAGLVKQTEGSIGYVELAYAVQNKLPYASLKNKSGQYVEPSFEAVSAAAAGFLSDMPSDLRVSIVNAGGKDSYPIAGLTWLLVYQNMKDKRKAKALHDFLLWALDEGESYAKDLHYAPLPKEVIALCKKQIAKISLK
jgi:phosphate transport system substrate-binding protein